MALSFIPGGLLPPPGQCVSCGSTGKDCVDTGRTESIYGAILVCVDCFRWAALNFLQLELMDERQYRNDVADYESKIARLASIEPTIAQLQRDMDTVVDRARTGFNQRRYSDRDNQRVPDFTYKDTDDLEPSQPAFFTVRELLGAG